MFKDWRVKYAVAVLVVLVLILVAKKTMAKSNKYSGGAVRYADKIPVHYRNAFIAKVLEISNTIGIHPDWLMMVMHKETGGTFSPSLKNKTSSATGLIQFMEATAKDLGTSTAALAQMTAVQQLDYVAKYFARFKGKLHSFADTYLAVFYPAAIGKADTWAFPNWVYNGNKGLDLNKNKIVTIGEFKQWMNNQ